MGWHRSAWLSIWMSCVLFGAACGDDGSVGIDGGVDGSTDATPDRTAVPPDTGPSDSGPNEPIDAGVDGGSRDECDPFTGGSCPDGQKCSVVFVIDDEGFAVDGYLGCVDTEIPEHRLGAPCSFSIDAKPDDSAVDAVADNCEQGLFCARQRSGGRECVRLCGGGEVDCGQGRFCLGLGLGLPGICEAATGCDPVRQDGCAASEGCYLITGTNGDVLATCLRTTLPDGGTGTTGAPCMFLSECAAGHQCTSDRLPDGGAAGSASCRAICRVAATSDGGVPDGGSGGGVGDGGILDGGDSDGGVGDGGIPDGGGSDGGLVDAEVMDARAGDAAGDGGIADGAVAQDAGVGCPSPDAVCSPVLPAEGAMVRTPDDPGICR